MFNPRYISLPLVCQTFSILQLHYSSMSCLTIDNHLTLAANDCYARISIGSKLPDEDVVSRTNVTSLSECEENCSKNTDGCYAFSFGVGVKGNSSCLISLKSSSTENLKPHPDYDVYAKKRQNSLWCNIDRVFKMFPRERGNGNRSVEIKNMNETRPAAPVIRNPFSKLPKSMPLLATISTLSFSRNKNRLENYGHPGVYDLFINHDKHHPSDDKSKFLNAIASNNERPSTDPFVLICHRKLQSGKKMMGLHVERVVNCENLRDCCRACDYEKTFACKGFNHRRRTDDSKCTCELTSTPYFRTDVAEDFLPDSHYDYYERMENCPSSAWHGSSIPHWRDPIKNYKQTGHDIPLDHQGGNEDYFRESPIPLDHSVYRESYPTNRDHVHDFSNGLVQSNEQFDYKGPHGFTPHHNSLNWNRNWKSSEPQHPDIANTFPRIGNNYDKDYLDVKSPVASQPPQRNFPHVPGYSNSNENEHFHGKLHNYGSAFDYNSNYEPVPREPHYEKHETSQSSKCSRRIAVGSKLNRRVVQKTCLAHDLEQCEDLCTNETSFSCKSFAYRYSVLTTNPTDNCLLSDHSYEDLSFYTDLDPNRDYDTYIIMSDVKICHFKKSINRHPSEECFARVKSGFAMPSDITKKSMFVRDLGECQYACTGSQEFVCRSLVFNYAVDNREGHNHEDNSFNCFLTDWSSEEINPVNMPDMDGAELYERNTSPSGCDHMYLLQPMNPNMYKLNDGRSSSPDIDDSCYSNYHRPCKLMPHAVVSSTQAVTQADCRRQCSRMRNNGITPCRSFNYVDNRYHIHDNCILSDVSIRDLRPNIDYVENNNHMLYTWRDFDPYCRTIGSTSNTVDNRNLNTGPSLRPLDDRTRISPVHWSSDFRPDEHEHDYRHEPTGGDVTPPYTSGSFEHGHNFFSSNQLSPFQRYTVNGYPCKNGTICQRNEVTGFWSCETEDEYDSWDYCCEPSHHCGFSQGYHYPWCYVGSNEDQWRPCSETYYPYYSSRDQSTFRQSSLYAARHWPVIYFHDTSPPNCSIDHFNYTYS